MKTPNRAAAAEYLAARSSFDAEQLLADNDVVAQAFAEATSQHPLHESCEHCIRLVMVRDVLVGAPVEGQLL